MLLILTSNQDFAVDYLAVRLLENGLPYIRLNAEELGDRHCTVSIASRGVVRELKMPNDIIRNLDDVTSVWYRRAIQPSGPADLSPAERNFVRGELRHHWMGLLLTLDARWVNPLQQVYIAEHKLYQLKVAREIGLSIPKTVVSDDRLTLMTFINTVDSVICKPIYHGLFIDKGQRYSVFTRRVSPADLKDLDSIEPCPVLLQEEIKRKADIRVTIIGDAIFAARITSSQAGIIDWRMPGLQLDYSELEISPDVERKCRQMMANLGLVYGAFDFIENEHQELVFLEVNPTGEWAWLEERLEFPMREAFIKVFYGKKRNES